MLSVVESKSDRMVRPPGTTTSSLIAQVGELGVDLLVPLGYTVATLLQQRIVITVDADGQYLVSLRDAVHYLLIGTGNDSAEDGMGIVQVGCRHVRDKELAAVGAGSSIGHG